MAKDLEDFVFFLFIHDNVLTNIYVGDVIWEILSLLKWPRFRPGCSPERWKNTPGGDSQVKVWATVAYRGDREEDPEYIQGERKWKGKEDIAFMHCRHALWWDQLIKQTVQWPCLGKAWKRHF